MEDEWVSQVRFSEATYISFQSFTISDEQDEKGVPS
jgi:hypothetical protein